MSKQALGKGLGALIPDVQERPTRAADKPVAKRPLYDLKEAERLAAEVGTIASVDIARIRPNPFQPRADFDREALKELRESIKEKGIIQPITVRQVEGGVYELVSGERRLRASAEAGLASIPAYVIEVATDREMLELALIENVQREKLNPIEVALGYQRLIDECHLTQEEVAKKIGKDRTTVTNFIRLLKLPTVIQRSLRSNEISMGHARALISIEDEDKQLDIWTGILKQNHSVRKVEQLVKEASQEKPAPVKGPLPLDKLNRSTDPLVADPATAAQVAAVESRLRAVLTTQVKVRPKANGGGELAIEYYTPDDLERLLDLFATLRG